MPAIPALTFGRPADALAIITRAATLEPFSPVVAAWKVSSLFLLGRHAEALAESRRGIEVDSMSPPLIQISTLAYLGANRNAEARTIAMRGPLKGPPFGGNLALAIGKSGDRQTALRMARDFEGKKQWFSASTAALAYLGVGDSARALDEFEKATVAREIWPSFAPLCDYAFDPICGRKRFSVLIRLVGLDDALSTRPELAESTEGAVAQPATCLVIRGGLITTIRSGGPVQLAILFINLAYAAAGVVLMYISFRVIDRLLHEVELPKELQRGNVVVAIFVGSLFVSIASHHRPRNRVSDRVRTARGACRDRSTTSGRPRRGLPGRRQDGVRPGATGDRRRAAPAQAGPHGEDRGRSGRYPRAKDQHAIRRDLPPVFQALFRRRVRLALVQGAGDGREQARCERDESRGCARDHAAHAGDLRERDPEQAARVSPRSTTPSGTSRRASCTTATSGASGAGSRRGRPVQLFMFASYNAGEGTIIKAYKLATTQWPADTTWANVVARRSEHTSVDIQRDAGIRESHRRHARPTDQPVLYRLPLIDTL